MPERHLPTFPYELTPLSSVLSVMKTGSQVRYIDQLGQAVSAHDEQDLPTFRLSTSQFCALGIVSQAEIARVFQVSVTSVRRAARLLREHGPAGFYARRRTRGAAVLTPPVLRKAQELLDTGVSVADVAVQLGMKRNTLSKALRDGRLRDNRDRKT